MKKLILLLFVLQLTKSISAQTAPDMGVVITLGLLANDTVHTTDTIRVKGDAGAGGYLGTKVLAANGYSSGPTITSALADLDTAKNSLAAQSGFSISGVLDGQSLSPGVYTISGSASLSDTLLLNGDTSSIFIFNISGDLTINATGYILLTMTGVLPKNVYWNIGGKLRINGGAFSGITLVGDDILIQDNFGGAVCLLSKEDIFISDKQRLKNGYGYSIQSRQNIFNPEATAGWDCDPDDLTCNLVTNPSFEIYDVCPLDGSLTHACDWGEHEYWDHSSLFVNHCEMYAACNDGLSVPEYGIVNNCFGSQTPYSGADYAGFGAYLRYAGAGMNYNWLAKELNNNLDMGRTYYLEYWISLSNNSNRAMTIETYITIPETGSGAGVATILYGTAPLVTTTTIPITSTSWTRISGCYTPSTPDDKAIVIKGTGSYPHPVVSPSNPSPPLSCSDMPYEMAYYFVDDMMLRPLSDAGADYTYDCDATNSLGVNCLPIDGATYLWTPADAPTATNATIACSTCVYTSFTASIPGTYTFNLTVTLPGGCVSTDQIVIDHPVDCSHCDIGVILTDNSPSFTNDIISASPPANANYSINHPNTVINGSVTFQNGSYNIGSGVTIRVPGGSILTISHSHLFACVDMWNGIVVEAGGKLIVNGSSLIEDAITAVYVPATTFTAPANYALSVSGAIFNKNYVSIKIDNYNYMATVYPFIIRNAVFTNRTLNYNTSPPYFIASAWTRPQDLKVLQSPGTLNEHYVDALLYPMNPSLGKPPYAGQKANTGVYLDNVGINIYEIALGNAATYDLNLYDNLVRGIYAYNTTFKTINSAYQYMKANTSGVGGIGVEGLSNVSNYFPVAKIQPPTLVTTGTYPSNPNTIPYTNKFYQCTRAVQLINYFGVIINGADVRSTQTETSPLIVNNSAYGRFGFYVKSNRYDRVSVCANVLTNVHTGIVFIADATPMGSYTEAQTVGPVNIDYNYVQAHYPGNTITNQYVRDAISATDVISTYGPGTGVLGNPGTDISIIRNRLTGVFRGIYAANWKRQYVKANFNRVEMRQEPNISFSAETTQYGISEVNNTNNTVIDNFVQGTTVSKDKWKGIYSYANTEMTATCNFVMSLGRGMEFEEKHFGVRFLDNTFFFNAKGYMLSTNGIIGPQTGPGANPATDNKWMVPALWTGTNYHTYTYFSDPNLSTIKVRTAPAEYYPTNNGALFATAYSSPSTIIPVAGGIFRTCDPLPMFLSYDLELQAKEQMELAIQDTLVNPVWSAETNIFNKHQVYRELRAGPDLLTGSSELSDFYTDQELLTPGILTAAEEDLKLNEFADAEVKILSISPVNATEEAYKIFYKLYIKHKTDTINSADSLALEELVNSCPGLIGSVVFQARALYNSIFNTYISYEDHCEEDRMFAATNQPIAEKTGLEQYDIYPNPSKEEFFITASDLTLNELEVEIRDVSGKMVFKNNVPVENYLASLRVNLENGIYLIRIVDPDKKYVEIKKIVISK